MSNLERGKKQKVRESKGQLLFSGGVGSKQLTRQQGARIKKRGGAKGVRVRKLEGYHYMQ